jgi:hypothetical protein
MVTKQFHISGRIINKNNQRGVPDLRVEAWDKDLICNDLVGSAISNAEGAFHITFDESYFRELFFDRRPDLFFKVFRDNELIKSTEDSVLWNVEAGDTEVTIEVDLPVPEEPKPEISHKLIGRLVNAATNQPLAGFTVRAFDLDAEAAPKPLGYDITNAQGLFVVVYTTPAEPEPIGGTTPQQRRLQFHIFDQHNTALYQPIVTIQVDQTEILKLQVPAEVLPQPITHPLTDLVAILNLQLPPALLPFLASQNIHTLEDILRAGGLQHLQGLPIPADDPAISILEAHAVLSVLSPAVEVNAKLIEKGFTSLVKIAQTPRSEFVSALQADLGDFPSAQLYVKADAQSKYLSDMLANRRADLARGVQIEGPIGDLYPLTCNCPDCESAVSPLAYLADLLKYALEHLRDDAGSVPLWFLEQTFCQPFGDLTAACEEMSRQIRQVQLCSEVLRRYLERYPLKPPVLSQGEARYRLSAYETLLNRIGTSYEELRLARTWRPDAEALKKRTALAQRLGIALRTGTAPISRDNLDRLLLDPTAAQTVPNALSEASLEKLFGLADTTRDPLSEAAKLNDTDHQITRWNLNGAEWNRNTDLDGQIEVRLTQPSAATYRVELYRPARKPLESPLRVASGERNTPTGPVTLQEENESGLSGSVTIEYTKESSNILIVAIPWFTSWRLAYLQQQWGEQDWPTDAYTERPPGFEGQRPVIDPDLIGPDDFRHPDSTVQPFTLWNERRDWVDQHLHDLEAQSRLEDKFNLMYGQVTYKNVTFQPWSASTKPEDFDALHQTLNSGSESEVTAAKDRIRRDLNLSVEAFSRLMEIRTKDLASRADNPKESVSAEEWREVDAILVQVQKERLFPDWCREEDPNPPAGSPKVVLFSPKNFWISLREPQEGDWPPVLPPGQPMIDPELVKRKDLPESSIGQPARDLWDARREELDRIRTDLQRTQEREDFDAMLELALGKPLPHNLADLHADLKSGDPARVTEATRKIEHDLYMTVDDFRVLINVKQKASTPPPAEKPTSKEWAEVYGILTSAQKRRMLYGGYLEYEGWLKKEAGLAYWQALKARLPRWRASVQTRFEWQAALRRRSQSPTIDPDVIDTADLQNPFAGIALQTWQQRHNTIEGWLTVLRQGQEQATDKLQWLNGQIQDIIGIAPATFEALADQLDQNGELTARLEQLSLTREAFSRLVSIRHLVVADSSSVLDSEWEEIFSILVQVQKRREFAQWRYEEQSREILLTAEHFKIPEPPPFQFPPPEPRQLPQWRATWRDRRDWQDLLQSRIDQSKTVIAAVQTAVSETEAATLPLLRDALINGIAALNQQSPQEAAKWLSDRLLIDCEAGSCQKTTRIAQAIETLQTLLFSLRTNQLRDIYPTMALNADNFDEEWEWLGSYATWRAAVFVFLYPENILLPHLRRWQTPGFRQLVKELGDNRRLTPEAACRAAHNYAEYLQDVCNLQLQASVQARTVTYEGSCRTQAYKGDRYLVYLFARGPITNSVYVSYYDPQDKPDEPNEPDDAQSFWSRVPALENVLQIVGSVAYAATPEKRDIYLFVLVQDGFTTKLVYTTFDLQGKGWSGKTNELSELPEEATDFTAVVKQRHREDDPPHLAVRLTKNGAIYDRFLNREGTGWAKESWRLLVGPAKGQEFDILCALIEPVPGEFYLFFQIRSENIQYRLFGKRDDGRWRDIFPAGWYYFSPRWLWIGGFPWLSQDLVYVYWKYTIGGEIYYQSLFQPKHAEYISINSFTDFDQWLQAVAGVSLDSLIIGANLISFDEVKAFEGKSLLSLLKSLKKDDLSETICTTYSYFILRSKLEEAGDERPWRDWKWANELVQKFSNRYDLGDALVGIYLNEADKEVRVKLREEIFKVNGELSQPPTPAISGLEQLVFGSGEAPPNLSARFAYQRTGWKEGLYRATLANDAANHLTESGPLPIAPLVKDPPTFTEDLSDSELQLLKAKCKQAFQDNAGAPASILTYLEEAWYFVPVQIALQLQRRRQFIPALDWFRTVYDYSAAEDDRIIYCGLEEATSQSPQLAKGPEWLLDPLNPHAIAASRPGTYLKFTLLAIIRCLLDFADAEFTLDTAESLPRARILYGIVLELLELPAINQVLGPCATVIDQELTDAVDDPSWQGSLWAVQEGLTHITNLQTLRTVTDQVKAALQSELPLAQRFDQAHNLVQEAIHQQPLPGDFKGILATIPGKLEQAHLALLAPTTVPATVDQVGNFAAHDFAVAISLVTGQPLSVTGGTTIQPLPWLRLPAKPAARITSTTAQPDSNGPSGNGHRVDLAGAVVVVEPAYLLKMFQRVSPIYLPQVASPFCVPPNPVPRSLHLYAELNLYKLRHCRNITGMEREIPPYGAPTDTLSGLPTIGESGQLVLPGLAPIATTLYRYDYLVERAKHLADRAAQMEAAFLAALEKRDAEYYNLMKARQDIQLARAEVQLQDLRVQEAEDGIALAELQQERSQIQANYYKGLLLEGVSFLEILSLSFLHNSAGLPTSVGVGGVSYSLSGWAEALAQEYSTLASYERRRREWQFQLDLANQDVLIGQQQVTLAKDRVRIVTQDRRISQMKADFAEVTAEFLATKFTNVELYDWMSDILEGTYSFFLQEATAVAKLAEQQLAFERQETSSALIQADYWEAPSDDAIAAGPDQKAPDRRGLTGSARLLQDIYKLDQYRFETEKRKLQLTKIISLARMDPFGFQRFRETGVLSFNSPLTMFDQDFPGHYLRLIKRLRVSVIALIPPTAGIHATLASTGLSRTVVGNTGLFQQIWIRRVPESVALTSPQNATGLFELAPQTSEMLLPFEGLGVDSTWELRMPKVSNQFDYSTLADVLLTLEYTALDSYDYRQQVIRDLDTAFSGDRPFSFKNQFADQWYDLHNPERTDTPMTVRFRTNREDLPPNLDSLKIQQVLLYFARRSGETFEVTANLTFQPDGEAVGLGGETETVDGIISTRRGNAGSWMLLVGQSPSGEWTLALPNTEVIKQRFRDEKIEDILFVITYAGRTPEWQM